MRPTWPSTARVLGLALVLPRGHGRSRVAPEAVQEGLLGDRGPIGAGGCQGKGRESCRGLMCLSRAPLRCSPTLCKVMQTSGQWVGDTQGAFSSGGVLLSSSHCKRIATSLPASLSLTNELSPRGALDKDPLIQNSL